MIMSFLRSIAYRKPPGRAALLWPVSRYEVAVADANPVPAFLEDRCILSSSATCWMKQLYMAYCTWSNENGFTKVQQQPTVKRNLEQLGYTITHGNQGNKVIGLKLK